MVETIPSPEPEHEWHKLALGLAAGGLVAAAAFGAEAYRRHHYRTTLDSILPDRVDPASTLKRYDACAELLNDPKVLRYKNGAVLAVATELVVEGRQPLNRLTQAAALRRDEARTGVRILVDKQLALEEKEPGERRTLYAPAPVLLGALAFDAERQQPLLSSIAARYPRLDIVTFCAGLVAVGERSVE